MHTDLHHLVYLSAATDAFSDDDLTDILAASRRNNPKRDITGMLLYSGGGFIQVLEGAKKEVFDLYEHIEQDPRHSSTVKLADGPIEERSFSEWEMGFQQVDARGGHLPGFSSFLDDPSPEKADRMELARPMKLLLSFKDKHAGAAMP
jgi:hypothetical protein